MLRAAQLLMAVLVIALFAGATHAIIVHIDLLDWLFDEELWVVNGPGGWYGVGISVFFDDCITVFVGPRSFTVPLGPQKLAVAAGGLLLVIGLVTGGTCALQKDRKVSA